jgi:hypothetical protein
VLKLQQQRQGLHLFDVEDVRNNASGWQAVVWYVHFEQWAESAARRGLKASVPSGVHYDVQSVIVCEL